MVSAYHDLQVTVKRLRDQIAQDEGALVHIRDLLAKADARRAKPQEDKRKWGKVAENLEASLDETRARLEHTRVTLRQMESQLAVAESAVMTAASPQPPIDDLTEDPIYTARTITLETLVQREADILQQPEQSAQTTRDLGRVELLNQLVGVVHPFEESSEAENRRQHLLRVAIGKIQQDQLDTITPQERRMLLICHSLLSRRLNPSPKDKHLLGILGAALQSIRQAAQGEQPPPLVDI